MKRWIAVLTIFLGSFLIFAVQPMVGRTLLPAFGGTAAVWVVCLAAFQALLLGGYGYAAWLSHGRGAGARARAHLAILALAAAWAVAAALLGPRLMAMVGDGGIPALEVLGCVLALAGLPYVALSANGPLVQAWAAGAGDGKRGVYRLYAVSNAGSLLGLVAYPFLFEPYLSLSAQWVGFGIGIAVYAVALGALVWAGRRADAGARGVADESETRAAAGRRDWALWFFLPGFSCFLLNAVTAHITLDVMPMPLMWTLLLGLFLMSYIIGFSGPAEKHVKGFGILALVFFGGACWMNGKTIREVSLPMMLVLYGGFLLAACTFVHAWLYRIRPAENQLTTYYFLEALGGAVGGLLASLAVPALFTSVAEYPIALFMTGLLAAAYLLRAAGWKILAGAIGVVLLAGGIGLYIKGGVREQRPVVYRGRGFFGTIEVLESKARTNAGEGFVREFVHGTTIHGVQALIPGRERMPTTYYTPNALGYAIIGHPKYRNGQPMRVNVIGLGIGILLSYARTNDYYRAYEISSDAMRVALDTNLFTFVSHCLAARKDLVLGDARKGLERELAAGVEPYDVILVDAFTGDNLPYHLSTKEAFDLYFKLLKPDGVLAVNISNWHLTLEPFMKKLSDVYQVPLMGLETKNDYGKLAFGAKGAFFCRHPEGLAPPPLQAAKLIPFDNYRPMPMLPTDEKGSFIDLIKW